MTMTLSLYDGVHTELDLIDAGGTDYYTHTESTLTFPPNEVVNTLTYENGRVHVYQAYDGAREFVVLVSLGGTRDTALNNAQAIHRWLRQARRASENEAQAHLVYLKVQEEGATNATIHQVLFGTLDESKSHLNWRQIESDAKYKVYKARLHLNVAPTGTTIKPIRMNNRMIGAPDMNRWDGTNDIHGWNKINGAEVMLVKHDRAYVGGAYMELTCSTNNHGIYSDYTGNLPAYQLAMGLAHLSIDSGTWAIRIETASGNKSAITGITAGNIDTKRADVVESRNGYEWSLLNMAQAVGQLTTEQQFRMRLICTTAPGTARLEACQIKDVEPYNTVANPGMDSDINTGGLIDGWEGSTDGLVIYAKDTGNYASSPASTTIIFSQTAGDSTTYFRQLLADPFLQNNTWYGECSLRITGHGGQTMKFALWDGADNEIDSVEFDNSTLASVASTSYTGDDAATYYVLEVSGTGSLAPGARLILYPTATSGSADIQFNLDEVRLLREQGPIFSSAYISKTGSLYNRNDYTSSEANNEYYVDNFRLANVPGNRPALVNLRLQLVSATTTDRTFFISRFTEEKHVNIQHWLECEDFGTGSGTWATNADAAWAHEAAEQFTGNGSTEGYIESALDESDLLSLASVPRLVFVRAKTDAATPGDSYMRFVVTHHFDQLLIENEEQPTFGTNNAELLYLGPLNLYYSEAATNFLRTQNRIRLYAYAENTEKIWADALLLLSAEENGWMTFHFPELYQVETVVVDSRRREVVRSTEGVLADSHRGVKALTAEPGAISTQFVVGWVKGSTLEHDVEQSIYLEVEIWPQTTTLLGTK